MNLYELFILGVNIKYIVFSILYRHINVPMVCKEFNITLARGLIIKTHVHFGYCSKSVTTVTVSE